MRTFRNDLGMYINHDLGMYIKEKSFTVKSTHRLLNSTEVWSKMAKPIWEAHAPLKVRSFMWLACRNAILTRDNLLCRKWMGVSYAQRRTKWWITFFYIVLLRLEFGISFTVNFVIVGYSALQESI